MVMAVWPGMSQLRLPKFSIAIFVVSFCYVHTDFDCCFSGFSAGPCSVSLSYFTFYQIYRSGGSGGRYDLDSALSNVRVLLLGTGESGKTTFAKQLHFLYHGKPVCAILLFPRPCKKTANISSCFFASFLRGVCVC